MPVELRKIVNRKRKIILVAFFLSICILYMVTELRTRETYCDEELYISKFLLSPASETVEVYKDAYGSFDIGHNQSGKNTLESNITITVLRAEDAKTSFSVVYPKVPIKGVSRNVFVDMDNINKSTENIIFIESRCSTEKMAVYFKGNKRLVLNARQCCAIESTANMNLDRNIYLFHSCSLDDDFFQHSPQFVEKLFKYPNIFVVRLNTTKVLLNSPLEKLQRKKLLEKSKYPVEHTSDLLRLALLWKFGGTYSDLDVVTIRSLNNLKSNWAGMQENEVIANGVINFEPEGEGHHMLQKALEYVNNNYNPTEWSTNGPLLITPIILEECRVKEVVEAQKNCRGKFTVYNSTVLYPIHYSNAHLFFNHTFGEKLSTNVKKSSYSVHIWNKMSHDLVVTVGSKQAYALLADEYCPQVYRNCGNSF